MRALIYCIVFLVIAGCVANDPVYKKDGREYGVTSGLFRDRWWNYFERGLSFAEGEFYTEAVSDLKNAIKRRQDDQWRSRTYVMHFINYFPHRELGIVYYRQNRLNDAQRELELSLKTAESAKAKYFLNRTRKAILEESGADLSNPSIKTDRLSDVTNKFFITVRGEAEDDHFVSSVSVNSVPLFIELSSPKVVLNEEVFLKKGTNVITVEASDLTGKTTKKRIKIEVDREGPVVVIEDQRIEDGKTVIYGYISDSTGVDSFSINENYIPFTQSQTQDTGDIMEFRHVTGLQDSNGIIILEARDRAGNITKGRIVSGSDSNLDSGIDGPALLASAGTMQYASGSILGKIIDSIPPVISIKELTDFQTVYSDSVFLEGSVSDKSRIKSLLINGESILKREGKKVFFNYLTKLKEGGNRFVIEAVDSFDNRTQKVLAVNRKVPKVRRIGSRMSVSILPLENKGELSVTGSAVYESLIAAFVNQRRFNIIEREKMIEVLNELKLSRTDLVDPTTAAKVGKILVADAILTGTVYETGNSIEVLTRMIDSETSRIIEAKDVFDEDRSLRSTKRLTEGLALKYKQSFPLLEGIVIKKDGDNLLTDLGEEHSIRKDMGLIVFREGDEISHPLTGKILGSEPVELGEAKIEHVYKEFSKAYMEKGDTASVKVMDKIITK